MVIVSHHEDTTFVAEHCEREARGHHPEQSAAVGEVRYLRRSGRVEALVANRLSHDVRSTLKPVERDDGVRVVETEGDWDWD